MMKSDNATSIGNPLIKAIAFALHFLVKLKQDVSIMCFLVPDENVCRVMATDAEYNMGTLWQERDEFSVAKRDFCFLTLFGGIGSPAIPRHATAPITPN